MITRIKIGEDTATQALKEIYARIPVEFRAFIANVHGFFNEEIRKPVFGGGKVIKSRGPQRRLQYRTGNFYRLGFEGFKQHEGPGSQRSGIAGIYRGHFFSEASNLFENWKRSKRPIIRLTLQARQAIEKSSKFNAEIENLTNRILK